MTWCVPLIFLASLCAAGTNLCMRKNLDHGGSSEASLVMYFIISLAVSFLINPLFTNESGPSLVMMSLGMGVGLLMVGMMILTSKALVSGPSATTFAFQNSSCVIPSLILAMIFGVEYGFLMTPGLIIGAACVIAGLFLAASKQKKFISISKSWYFFATMMFLMQAFILTMFQWRCLITQSSLPEHPLIPISCLIQEDVWFMPGLFIASSVMQAVYFFAKHRRWLKWNELFWGSLAGIGNGASTYFLLNATLAASTLERNIAFPLFAVMVIVICNLWGKKLYREPVSKLGTALCIGGILIAGLV